MIAAEAISGQPSQQIEVITPRLATVSDLLPYEGRHPRPIIRIVNTVPRLGGKTLAQTPDEELTEWHKGAHGLYLLGIKRRSEVSKWLAGPYVDSQYKPVVPEITQDQNIGSAFANAGWRPDKRVASSNAELAQQVERFHQMGVETVITDVVPGHVAPDSKLVSERNIRADMFIYTTYPPDFPHHVYRGESGQVYYLAWGNKEWQDTVQLNYASENYIKALENHVRDLVKMGFDGGRFDVAMHGTARIFNEKWGHLLSTTDRARMEEQIRQEEKGDVSQQFFARIISAAKSEAKKQGRTFTAIAETYSSYGQNGNLLKQGFDRIYDHDRYRHMMKVFRDDREPIPYLTDRIAHEDFNVYTEYNENQDEPPEIYELGMRAYQNWYHNPEDEIYVQRGIRTSRAATVLVAGLPTMYLEGDMQQEGYFGERVPMQISVLPTQHYRDQREWYRNVLSPMKGSDLLQRGRFNVPHLIAGGYDIVYQHGGIIPIQYQTEREAAVICVNTKDRPEACHIPVPQGAEAAIVFDLQTGKALPRNIIDTLQPGKNDYFVGLRPNGAQMVVFPGNFAKNSA